MSGVCSAKAIRQETQARIDSKTSTSKYLEEQANKEQSLLEQAEDLKTKISKVKLSQRIKLVYQEEEKLQKDIEKLYIQY